jgi:hypothetical protein
LILAGALILLGAAVVSGAQEQTRSKDTLQQQEDVYGWQMMSEQERHEHQQQMREMKTEPEREAFRKQHHEKMQERARQQGLTLPDSPGPHGKGMGPGSGYQRRGGK